MSHPQRFSTCKRINEVCLLMLKAGWTTKRSKRHHRLVAPNGKFIMTVPSTPSDFRAALNFISDVRKYGVDV